MNNLKRIGLIILSTIALAGCVSSNPNYDKTKPATDYPGPNPVYIPATNQLAQAGGIAHTVVAATAPADPYAPLVDKGVDVVLGIISAFSLSLAAKKNRQAQQHAAAATTLAQTLPDSLVKQAVENAPTPEVSATVAAILHAVPNSTPPAA